MSDCIVFTGGGTAGHVFPALAVVEELQAPLWTGRVVWIGSVRGMERELVRERGIPYYGVPAGKLRRYLSVRNLFDLLKIGAGVLASLIVLLRERPRLLFSKGGYVSVPPVIAAWLMRVPVVTHESDLEPGLATRINARFAESVLVSFPESARYFGGELRSRVTHTGNPVRAALLRGDPEAGRRRVGCGDDRPLVLVLGGSLGSRFINQLVEDGVGELTEHCFVVHQMGSAHYEASSRTGYFTAPFFREELPDVLAAAALVISRSGANTVWELAALGKPAMLIPLGRAASRGDQIENARYLEEQGAAVVLEEAEATPRRLVDTVVRLLTDATTLRGMAERARELGRPRSAQVIATLIAQRSGRVGVPDAV
ncbi:MAG: undecaprenyldiphospho-muramoylpentapeptide beta-N-acetylglucosaminyltransferase [Spirochaetales bacterium]|nr:undecaprenyldiphospho-muramoylpentapeptide beta-N-acetylglucosaminyltransferase [Spirochaetales bacterium]